MKKQNNVVDDFLGKPKKKSRRSNKSNNSPVVRVSLNRQKASSNKLNDQVFSATQKKAVTGYKRLINDIQAQLSFSEKIAEKTLHSKLGSATNFLVNDIIFNNSFWATTLCINFLLVSLAFALGFYNDVKITTSIVFVILTFSGLMSLLTNVIRKRK